jgi:hypothetical protein
VAQDRKDSDLAVIAELRERVRTVDQRVAALGRHL